MRILRKRWRLVLGSVLAFAGMLLLSGMLIAWSGVYNIAASRGHWAIVEWFLRFGMRNSVDLRANGIDSPPTLNDENLIRLGAAHFHGGCAYCHGGPGILVPPIARQMLPPPPDLSTSRNQWKDKELFWIVKHGIKYTGMPGWTDLQRDDEVWALVAFLKRLPELTPKTYLELALGGLEVQPQAGRELAVSESTARAVSACARCHGADDRGPTTSLAPILHGQPADFLMMTLRAYADGTRPSGIMQPVATDLSPEAVQSVSQYYAGLPALPPRHDASVEAGALKAGRELATQGSLSAEIPPCLTCHGATALPLYPRLAGQSAAYIRAQLRVMQRAAPKTPTRDIMTPIARRLNDQQIDAVAAYFSALPSGAAARLP